MNNYDLLHKGTATQQRQNFDDRKAEEQCQKDDRKAGKVITLESKPKYEKKQRLKAARGFQEQCDYIKNGLSAAERKSDRSPDRKAADQNDHIYPHQRTELRALGIDDRTTPAEDGVLRAALALIAKKKKAQVGGCKVTSDNQLENSAYGSEEKKKRKKKKKKKAKKMDQEEEEEENPLEYTVTVNAVGYFREDCGTNFALGKVLAINGNGQATRVVLLEDRAKLMKVGDILQHPTHGKGLVKKIHTENVTVIFGRKKKTVKKADLYRGALKGDPLENVYVGDVLNHATWEKEAKVRRGVVTEISGENVTVMFGHKKIVSKASLFRGEITGHPLESCAHVQSGKEYSETRRWQENIGRKAKAVAQTDKDKRLKKLFDTDANPDASPAQKAQRKRDLIAGMYSRRRLVESQPMELCSPEGTPRHSDDTPRNTEGAISPDLVQVVDLSSSSPVVTGAGFAAVVLIPCFLAYRLMKCWGKRKQFERPAISEDVTAEDRV